MNTKKIWLWSFILGIMVAFVAYFALLPSDSTSLATGGQVDKENVEKTEENESENSTQADGILKREMSNPIVEVAEGKRAISIYVDTAPGVSGYVEPESKVDVIAYETTEDEKKEREFKSAVLVLENVKVLTSGQSSDSPENALQYQTVTLEVTPEEGVMLGLASKDKDGFYLMLRNEEDSKTGKKGYKETREVIKDKPKEDDDK